MSKKHKESKFKGSVGADARKQKSSGSSYGYLRLPKGVNVFSVDPGSVVKLDFIPYIINNPKHPDINEENGFPAVGELWYKRPFKIHRNVGVEKETVVCLSSFGKKCPICEYWAKRKKEGADKEELDSIKPTLRNLYCVVPKGSKKYEEKPYVWDISQYLFQALLNEELETDDDNEIFPDLEGGKTLQVRFESKTMGTGNAFANAKRIDFKEREEQYDESILDEVPDLDSLLSEMSYKQMETKFFEMEEEVAETDDDEPVKKPAKKKPVEEDEDEDDVPDEPVRKKKVVEKPKAKPVEEDEDEDEDEDEAPVQKKPSIKPKPTAVKRKPVEDDEEDEDPTLCIACQGTGKDSKGRTCPICKGTGRKSDPENYMSGEDEDEDELPPLDDELDEEELEDELLEDEDELEELLEDDELEDEDDEEELDELEDEDELDDEPPLLDELPPLQFSLQSISTVGISQTGFPAASEHVPG